MKTIAKSLFLALPLSFAPAAIAQHQTFTVNPDASKVAFSLGGNAHHVDGTFHVQSGSIDFDRTRANHLRLGGCRGRQRQQRRSGPGQEDELRRSRRGALCRNLLCAQELSGNRCGQRAIPPSKSAAYSPLHGTPHDLTVPMQIHIDGTTLTAKTHFTIPYVKWGLKDPSIFILKVAKEVDIDLTLVGRLSSSN